MVMDIGFSLLRSFIAIVDAGTISGASEVVYLSQPALSKQLKRLEAAVGAQLLERGSRQVRLTDAGHELLPYVRASLEAWDQGGHAVAAIQGRATSSVRIGMHAWIGRGLIRSAREQFTNLHRDWSFQIRHIAWDDASAGLDTGQTDIALRWSPIPDRSLYEVRRLLSGRVMLLVANDHDLANRSSVTVDELAGAPMVAMPPGAGAMRDYWLGGGIIADVSVAVEATSGDESYEAVASGLGLALVPAYHAPGYPRDGVSFIPVEGLPECELYVVWRADEARAEVTDLAAIFTKVNLGARSPGRPPAN